MLCIVGAGNMGRALLGGLIADGRTEVAVVERRPERRASLQSEFPTAKVVEGPIPCDGAIIAVKPKDVEVAVTEAVEAGAQRVLSLATGYTLQHLHEITRRKVPVARAMPNVGATVGRSATAVCGQSVEMTDWAESVMQSAGVVVRVEEKLFDAVTGLSGSGPAYVFLVAEAMIDAGVQAGLPRATSRTLAIATLQGAADLLASSDVSASELRGRVTTPGQTTVAGLRVLEQRAVRAAFLDAVDAAAARSRELSREHSQ